MDLDVTLDGVSIMNSLHTTVNFPVSPDAVQEVSVQTGTYSAQYGSYLGVHINADELPPHPTVNSRLELKRYTEPGHATWGAQSYVPLSFDRPEPINHVDAGESVTDPIGISPRCITMNGAPSRSAKSMVWKVCFTARSRSFP